MISIAIILSIVSLVLIFIIIGIAIAYYIYDQKKKKKAYDQKIQDEKKIYDQQMKQLTNQVNTQNTNITGLDKTISRNIKPSISIIDKSIADINTNLGSNIQPSITNINNTMTDTNKNVNNNIQTINGELVDIRNNGNIKDLNVTGNANVAGQTKLNGGLIVNGDLKLGNITMNADGSITANKLKVDDVDVKNKGPFIGPQGPQGPQGPVGPQGPQLQGDVSVNKINIGDKFTIDGATMYNKGRQHIHGEELLYLLNKSGVVIGKEWGGNGNLSVQGNLGVGDKFTIDGATMYNKGRQHIHGEELLYLLNKAGVVIGKEWGGNGNLSVQGNLGVGAGVPGDWRSANFLRKDGRWTHFDWKDNGQNYLRGYTNIDDGLGVNGDLNVNGKTTISRGDGNWNWLRVAGNHQDNIYLGSDNDNRGIWADGPRDFSIFNQGKKGITVTQTGDVNVNTKATIGTDLIVTGDSKSATLNTTGAATIGTNLIVTGNSKSATLNTTGLAKVGTDLIVTGDSKSATLNTTGAATIGANLTATGNIDGGALCIQGRCLTLADINKIKALP